MIVQTIQRNVVESHDFKSEIATIDAEEMRYVSSLLRNNYSDTILATVRETFANAVDANAGSDRAVKIIAPTRIDPNFRVRDFGKGLSEDELFGLYTKYGRSTKRNDNASIGGFGIGRFAPLSYTDTFTVSSVCNGQRTVISVYVDEFGDTRFTKMDSGLTNERSGIEISVAVKSEDVSQFESSIVSILRFSDARFETNIKFDPIKWKIKGSKWGVSAERNENGDCLVVMGGIPYPLSFSAFAHHKIADTGIFKLFNNSYVHQNFVFFFPVGSVSLHHSRESLEYNQNTKNYIANAITQLETEVKEVVQKQLDGISDSAEFFVKLAGTFNRTDIGSLCFNSQLTFTAKDGSKHIICPSDSANDCAVFQRSQRTHSVVRKFDAGRKPFTLSPTEFYTASSVAILADDGVRNIAGRAENILINNENIGRVYVINYNVVKCYFLSDYNSRPNIYFASKVDPICKQKKKDYENVRLIYNKESYIHSGINNKIAMPDSQFYYVDLVSDGKNGKRTRFKVEFGSSNSDHSPYKIYKACDALGIQLDNKIYGVVKGTDVPDYAINLGKVFFEKLNALADKFNSFINRDKLSQTYANSLEHINCYIELVPSLPKDHIISQYINLKNSSVDDSANLATEYRNFIGIFDEFIEKSRDISSEEKQEISKKALTIRQKYPMMTAVLSNRYFYSLPAELSKTFVDYINLVDRNS